MRPNPKIRAVDTGAPAPVSTVAEVVPNPETSAPVGSVGTGRWVRLANRFAPTLTFIFVLAVWELGCRVFRVPTFLLPPPSLIVRGAFEQSASIWAGHVWATVRVAVMGYVAAIAISIPMAIALASSRALSRTLYPLIVVVHSMPIVAVAPIIVVTLGASDLPRVVITFLIAFFPIVVTTTTGLLATPEEMIELSRSLRAGRTREMLHIRLPFALPYIFSALKIATTLSVVGAVVAEFVAAERGLGYFIQFSTSFFKINQGFAALVILVTISLGFFQVIGLVQRIFAPWSLPKSER
jgi:NitT/TauT family transport system permease protein